MVDELKGVCMAPNCEDNTSMEIYFMDLAIELCEKHVTQLALAIFQKSNLPTFQEALSEGLTIGATTEELDFEDAWLNSETRAKVIEYTHPHHITEGNM